MIEHLKTLRDVVNLLHPDVEQYKKAVDALTQLEAMVESQEPVGWVFRRSLIQKFRWHRDKPVGQEALLYWEPVYTAAPVAQQPLLSETLERKDALLRQALDALCLPCDCSSLELSKPVGDAVDAIIKELS